MVASRQPASVIARSARAILDTFKLAENHLTRRVFGAVLQRIWTLPVPAGNGDA